MDKATAMNFLKNTFVDYTLINGETIKLTMAFALLKELENRNPELVNKYYKLSAKRENEFRDLDMVTILYTAYMCANLDNPEVYDEEIFTILLGSDRLSMRYLSNQLMGAKKKQDFVKRS